MIELIAGRGMALSTPLGAITMTVSQLHAVVEPDHALQPVGTDGLSCAWTLPDLSTELSIFPFDAGLDPDVWVRPVHCWAFVWDLAPLGPCPSTTLELSFADPALTRNASPDGGQAFIALSVAAAGWELIIGGPDEEQLAADAILGLVPHEWRTDLTALAPKPGTDSLVGFAHEMRGLRWTLPAMRAGQRCQIGANACWSPSRLPTEADDESPWFAAMATTATQVKRLATRSSQ
jgi:hypothetical protein